MLLIKSVEELRQEKSEINSKIEVLWESVKSFISKLYDSQTTNQKIQQEVTQKLLDKYSTMVADNYINIKDDNADCFQTNNSKKYISIEPDTEKVINLILDTKSISSLSQSRRENLSNNLGVHRNFENTYAYTNSVSQIPLSNDEAIGSNFVTNNYLTEKKSRINNYQTRSDISNFPESYNKNFNYAINFNYENSINTE